MRFLIDADLPRPTADLIGRMAHEAVDVRDIGLGAAKDPQIAAYAQANRLCLLTGDFDFSDIREYPPEDYSGLVVLTLPENANRDMILRLIESFLRQTDVLRRLPGRLAIVEFGRIRLRPP
jgi:predicted nuclease of predicted toxin-antitoxin system